MYPYLGPANPSEKSKDEEKKVIFVLILLVAIAARPNRDGIQMVLNVDDALWF